MSRKKKKKFPKFTGHPAVPHRMPARVAPTLQHPLLGPSSPFTMDHMFQSHAFLKRILEMEPYIPSLEMMDSWREE